MVREQDFETVKAHYSAKGMTIRRGKIVDATFSLLRASQKDWEQGPRDATVQEG